MLGNCLIARNCYPEVLLSLFYSLTIAGYCYPEVDQFPINNNQKLLNFRVSLHFDVWKSNIFLSPGNNTRKLTKMQICWANIQGTLPGNCLISEYRYPEISQFPSNNAQILFYCRLSLPRNRYEIKLFSWITSQKLKSYWKYFRLLI